MNPSAQKIIPMLAEKESVIKTATVLSFTQDKICIDIFGEKTEAKKAFSCLVDPQPDDTVLCVKDENSVFYIMGIIQRPEKQKMDLSFPSDANIVTHNGNLHLHSRNNLTMTSENFNCFSKRAIHKSQEAILSCSDVTATGHKIQAKFQTVHLISSLINTTARQVMEKFKAYIRTTEDNDMVKSGHMTRKTDGLYAMDSEHTIMNSKQSTKIDGKKILMG